MLTLTTTDLDATVHGLWLEASTREHKDVMKTVYQRWIKDKTYIHDPLWKMIPRIRAMSQDMQPLILLHLLDRAEIRDPQWRHNNYESYGIRTRLTLSAAHPAAGAMTLALFRHDELPALSADDLRWITGAAPLLMRLSLRHQGIHMGQTAPSRLAALESRLNHVRKSLTPREVQVCARILQCESFEHIAQAIGIKPASVKTYRDRAFTRLGITSHFELFALLLN